MPSTITKQTLSEQIYRVLREDILNQEIKCGQKLTLQSLKERFSVSHTPIREALTRLVEDNLVNYYSNVGVTVVSLNENDTREIFELNGDLDLLAMRYAYMGPYREKLLSELDQIVEDAAKELTSGHLDVWRGYSDDFHLIFYKYANNSRLGIAAQKLRAQITLIYNLYQFEAENPKLIQDDHMKIKNALISGDFDRALQHFENHLERDAEMAKEASKRLAAL